MTAGLILLWACTVQALACFFLWRGMAALERCAGDVQDSVNTLNRRLGLIEELSRSSASGGES